MVEIELADILISVIAISVPVVIFLFTLFQRLARLETKFDCLLTWVIEIDIPNRPEDSAKRIKRESLKKEIEKQLNGNACKVD